MLFDGNKIRIKTSLLSTQTFIAHRIPTIYEKNHITTIPDYNLYLIFKSVMTFLKDMQRKLT